ncbi:hypothetical protein GCM10012275_20880 [Longimycelium tulufanense]|uniref:Uncharacterized protein n=1 Tax=Longimycelium tulufanense TaxID=907463 RepID=A0A8J3CDF1_9PSEU|nr:hypothetical protein [Longimycelium tulufanense]GGM49813.1 hypothetical protein GCM10012275_20880 [Longimycelium tulufanense]
MSSLKLLAAATRAALLIVLAGCTGAQPASTPVEDPHVTLGEADLKLLTMEEPYAAERERLAAVDLDETKRCMRKEGFDYPVASPDSAPDYWWRPNMAERRRDGYGFHKQGATPPRTAVDDYVEALPDGERARYDQVLFGREEDYASIDLVTGQRYSFPTDGCTAAAAERLYGSPAKAALVYYLPQEVRNNLLDRIEADPVYHEVVGRWSQCMKARGYELATPSDARQTVGARVDDAPRHTAPEQWEVEIAVADGECVLETDVPASVSALLRRYADTLNADERRQLVEAGRAHTEAVRKLGG